ncbi:hypothetical protein IU443_28485 [Nocardia farcinica]|uniref:hypothetical protein n=1 Tax=Nocardia farcinica TaxID=37329 RepID=UPI001892F698|nr:hypothetical protein [Nocardia farcinica]MBF6393870.1 hypothetical protein [Nocardia farcinica]
MTTQKPPAQVDRKHVDLKVSDLLPGEARFVHPGHVWVDRSMRCFIHTDAETRDIGSAGAAIVSCQEDGYHVVLPAGWALQRRDTTYMDEECDAVVDVVWAEQVGEPNSAHWRTPRE